MKDSDYQLFSHAKETNNIKAMHDLYEKNKNEFKIAFQYSKMLIKRKQYTEAKEVLSDILKFRDDIFAKFELGKIEAILGNVELAREYYNSILVKKQDNYVLLELGKLEYSLNNVDKAKEIFFKLLGTNSEHYALFELGKIELANNDLSKAKEYFEKILEFRDDYFAKFELSKIEFKLGHLDVAKIQFEQLLREKNDEYVELELGKVEFALKNLDKARSIFKKLIESRNAVLARFELAKLELADNNIKLARELLERNSKSDLFSKLELGRLEKNEGNLKKARELFKGLLNTSNAKYGYYELGMIDLQEQNLEEAKENLKNSGYALNDSYVLKELGRLEFAKGKISEAKEIFKSLLNTNYKIKALAYLTIICIKNNELHEAFDYFMEYRENSKTCDSRVELYLMKQLNIFFTNIYTKNYNYLFEQIINYDEYMAIEHILERHANEFSENIDLYVLYNIIKKELVEENKVRTATFNDFYDITYPNIGVNNEQVLRVITVPNSKNIITMFPIASKLENLNDVEEDNLDSNNLTRNPKKNYYKKEK